MSRVTIIYNREILENIIIRFRQAPISTEIKNNFCNNLLRSYSDLSSLSSDEEITNRIFRDRFNAFEILGEPEFKLTYRFSKKKIQCDYLRKLATKYSTHSSEDMYV